MRPRLASMTFTGWAQRVGSLLMVAACSVLMLAFLDNRGELEASRREYRAVSERIGWVRLLVGTSMVPDPLLIPLRRPPTNPRRSNGGHQVLIVAGTGCEACQLQVGEWAALARALRLDGPVHWLLITVDTPKIFDGLAPVLDAQGHPYTLCRAKDSALFALGTGISSTPTLVVLDATNTVLLVVRRLTPAAKNALLAAFRERPGGG